MILLQPPLETGDVVRVEAVDWGIYEQQVDHSFAFTVVRGVIYGKVVQITNEHITIAPQVFADGGVRYALSLPIACIESVYRLGVV